MKYKEGSKAEEKRESPKKEASEIKRGDKELNPKANLKSKKKKYFPSSDGAVYS